MLRTLQLHAYDAFNTQQRLSALETVAFCTELRKDCQYVGPYRPALDLVQIADDALHQLMRFRPEHNDPLAF